MRAFFYTAIIASISLLLGACSGIKIQPRVEASPQMQQVKTYAWKAEALTSNKLGDEEMVTFDRNVRQAVESILLLKGYKQADTESADMLMDYRVTVVPTRETAEQYRNPGMAYETGAAGRIEFNDWGNTQAESEFYERGYLALTVFEPKSNKIWWEMVASKMMDQGDSKAHRERTLRQVVGKMMKTLPEAAQ